MSVVGAAAGCGSSWIARAEWCLTAHGVRRLVGGEQLIKEPDQGSQLLGRCVM